MRKLLFIFIDGVGLGNDTMNNPIKDLFSPITSTNFISDNFPKLADITNDIKHF